MEGLKYSSKGNFEGSALLGRGGNLVGDHETLDPLFTRTWILFVSRWHQQCRFFAFSRLRGMLITFPYLYCSFRAWPTERQQQSIMKNSKEHPPNLVIEGKVCHLI